MFDDITSNLEVHWRPKLLSSKNWRETLEVLPVSSRASYIFRGKPGILTGTASQGSGRGGLWPGGISMDHIAATFYRAFGWLKTSERHIKTGFVSRTILFFWVIEVIIIARSQPKTSPKTLGNGYKGSNSPMAKGSDTPIRFRLPSEELQLDQRWVGQKTLVGFFPWSWSTFFTMSSKGMGAAWLWLVDGSTLFSRRGSCKTSLKTTILRWNGIIFC